MPCLHALRAPPHPQGAAVTWGTFLMKNLFPVTLGNIIGGAVAVALGYTLAYKE